MMEKKEVTNVSEVFAERSVLRLHCKDCGRELMLWYNGGELDSKDCCGWHYELQSPIINLIISKKE